MTVLAALTVLESASPSCLLALQNTEHRGSCDGFDGVGGFGSFGGFSHDDYPP